MLSPSAANAAAMSDKMLAAIRGISKAPIRYIVNTSADLDHVGGNQAFAGSAAAPGTGSAAPEDDDKWMHMTHDVTPQP